MRPFIDIFIKTKETFHFLNQQYEDDLNNKVNLIFVIVGLTLGLQNLIDKTIINYGILFMILALLISGGFMFIIGKYITSYIIYGISKILGGKAKIIDIRVVVAYSQIPSLLLLPIILLIGISHSMEKLNIIISIFAIICGLSIWVLELRISLIGLKYFNKYGTLKALINLTPILIIGIILHSLSLYFVFR